MHQEISKHHLSLTCCHPLGVPTLEVCTENGLHRKLVPAGQVGPAAEPAQTLVTGYGISLQCDHARAKQV